MQDARSLCWPCSVGTSRISLPSEMRPLNQNFPNRMFCLLCSYRQGPAVGCAEGSRGTPFTTRRTSSFPSEDSSDLCLTLKPMHHAIHASSSDGLFTMPFKNYKYLSLTRKLIGILPLIQGFLFSVFFFFNCSKSHII